MLKIQNKFGHLDLEFGIYLGFSALNLGFKKPALRLAFNRQLLIVNCKLLIYHLALASG